MAEKISKLPSRYKVLDLLFLAQEVVVGFQNPYDVVAEDVVRNLRESIRVFGSDASDKCRLAHAEYLALHDAPNLATNPQFPSADLDHFIKLHFQARHRGRLPAPDEVPIIRRHLADY